jgi:hypothetical protein
MKPARLFYRIVLPIFTAIILLWAAMPHNRMLLLGSPVADFSIRLLLTLWFCGLYFQLSRISDYTIYPKRKWTREDLSSTEKYVYTGIALLFSLCSSFMAWGLMHWFFPASTFSPLAAGFIIFGAVSVPLVSHYWVLKL